jgi:hypothetical protein
VSSVLEFRPGTRLVQNPVRVLDIIDIKTPRGFPPRQLVLFSLEETDGERVAWFTTSLAEIKDRPPQGTCYYLTGTIKRHGIHKGIPQTEVVGVTLEPVR